MSQPATAAAAFVILDPFPAFDPQHAQHCPNTSLNKQKHHTSLASSEPPSAPTDEPETKRQKSDAASASPPPYMAARARHEANASGSGGKQAESEEKDGGRGTAGDGLYVPFVSGSGRRMLRIRGTVIEVDGEHIDDVDVGPEDSHISMTVDDDEYEYEEEDEEQEEHEHADEEEVAGDERAEGQEGEEQGEKEGVAGDNDDADEKEDRGVDEDKDADGAREKMKEGDDDDDDDDDEDYVPTAQDEAEYDEELSRLRELVARGRVQIVDDDGQEYYVVAEDEEDDDDDDNNDEENDEDEEDSEDDEVADGGEVDDPERLAADAEDDERWAGDPVRRLRSFRRQLPSASADEPDDSVDKQHIQPFLRQTHHRRQYADKYPLNNFAHLRRLESSASTVSSASVRRSASLLHSSFLPSATHTHSLNLPAPVFCGRFSSTGSLYCCASQDSYVHLYTTDPLRRFKTIECRDVEWAVIDVDFSHNQRFVVYSGWSNCLQLVNVPDVRGSGQVDKEYELHEALDLRPGFGRSCMFSTRFNPTDTELLAGLNRGVLIVYDIERKVNVLKAAAHSDDINTVCYLDAGDGGSAGGGAGNLMLTGSDDHLIKVWDRRTQSCIGGWIAHTDGLTSVVSCCDGQYVLSNSKDQSAKLHDMRRMNKCSELAHYTPTSQPLDYRYRRRRQGPRTRLPADHSLVTYTGHTVMQTLIRCGVSPPSVGRRYVYTGSSDGRVYVFEAATGRVAQVLDGHGAIVREVHWSPRGDCLMSASWDETVARWEYREEVTEDSV